MARFSGEHVTRRVPRLVSGTAPAAGADATLTVPAGRRWQVLAVSAALVTSAAVANRRARLSLNDGVATWALLPGPVDQVASKTFGYLWFPGAVAANDATQYAIAMPELHLDEGAIISTSTTAIDVADQWGTISVNVIEETIQWGAIDMDDAIEAFAEALSSLRQ